MNKHIKPVVLDNLVNFPVKNFDSFGAIKLLNLLMMWFSNPTESGVYYARIELTK